jgi:hypothetical protein
MKTDLKLNMKSFNFDLILFIAIVLGIFAGHANAQGLYIGLEASNSSRSFTVNSDLQNFNGAKLVQQGMLYGITMGNRLISGKMRLGNFRAAEGDDHPIKSNSFELVSSFSPLQLIVKRNPIIEPYVTLSMETTKIKTTGTYTPPAAKPKSPGSTCSCQCPSTVGGPPDPDGQATAAAISAPVPFTGNFGSTRASVGIGFKAHLQKGKLFLTVYGEMNYGISLGTTASTQALLNTYVLNQAAFNTGISLGYIYTKTGHRLRKISFR